MRVYKGYDDDEITTTNQLFELELAQDKMENTGEPLKWTEDKETKQMLCKVNLRHFNSGRLL